MSRPEMQGPRTFGLPMRVRLLLLALLFALPVLVLAILQFQRQSDRVQQAATAAVNSAADALAQRLGQDLTGAEAVARSIGAVDLRQPGAAAACSLALQRAATAAGPRITNYLVATRQGQVVCSGKPMHGPVNVADRRHFQQALQTGLPALSGFVVGRISGQHNVQLAVPVLDAGGRVTAVAVAGLRAASLVADLRTRDGAALTLVLFDRDGALVGRSSPLSAGPGGRDAAASDLFRQRTAMTRGATELRGLDGVSRLYASRAIALHGETVLWAMSGVDGKDLRAAVLAAQSRDLGMVLLLALAVAAGAFVVGRALLRQRQRGLFDVAADVAVGHYRSRVALTVQDDITAVEVAFNGMLDAVEADRSKLEQANHALLREIASREASESALQARELELRDAKRLAGLGSWQVAADGSVRWSQETFAIFGRDPALGAPSAAEQGGLLTADSLAVMEAGLRSILADGQPYQVELEGIRPDGTPCWINARGEAVRDAAGALAAVRGTVLDITELKLAERAVRRSQRQLRHVMDGLAPSMFVGLLTPQGTLVEVNRSPLTAVGVQGQDVLGRPFVDAPWWRGSPLARQQLGAAITRAADGESSHFELQTRDAQGRLIDLDFSLQPLRDEHGEVIFLIPSAVVITERKRAEMALRESESVFRALAESMPQIVWMTRPDGWNIYCNQRWTDYTGLTLAQSCGHGWIKPFHPQDQQRALDAWQVATTTISTYMLESRLRRADGVYRWWLVRGEPQRDADGAVLKWVGTCTDIHDLKLAELEISRANGELLRQQSELRALFDLMPAVILFKDTENRILRINQLGADAAGLRIDEIEGRLAHDIYANTGVTGYIEDLERIESGKQRLTTVQMIRDLRGEQLWVQRDRVPYRDVDGKLIGIVVMVQDVSQRKRDQDALRELNTDLESRVRDRTAELNLARSQAEEASRAKSDFLAAMSHEIRTPMSGLLGLLELLELSALNGEQHSTLGLARDSGTALLSIIDDILDFSKIEANRLELDLVASPIGWIVENACRLHSPAASSKNLLLHLDVAPQISPLLAVDPLRLGQILNNFLNNAIKFTERGSVDVVVELAARGPGTEQLRFIVRDTGIGMSRQQMGRLFQPFVQAQPSTSTRFGGTGLGLAIARRLAELMGGTVEIDSEPDRGTTVTLLLALEVCDPAAAGQPAVRGRRETLAALVAGRRAAPSIEDAQAEGTLLLVVDDHPTNRLVLVRQLASLGYAALAADDGVEALALWRSHRFGAMISDCNMPRMNGYELAAAIRREEQQQGLERMPAIACTANALPAAIDACIAAGMNDYVVKPAGLSEISRKLERWLPLPGAHARPSPAPALAAVQPAALACPGLLDLDLLSEISGGSAPIQRDILDDFRRVNVLEAQSVQDAADANDLPLLLAGTHRIKGACLMMGATSLAGACAGIEVAVAAQDPAAVRTAMAGFRHELQRLERYLDGLRESLAMAAH